MNDREKSRAGAGANPQSLVKSCYTAKNMQILEIIVSKYSHILISLLLYVQF
jgi:hypothetical protein